MYHKIFLLFLFFCPVFAGCVFSQQENVDEFSQESTASQPVSQSSDNDSRVDSVEDTQMREVDFSEINDTFLFRGRLPENWNAEYVSGSDAVNIYETLVDGISTLDQSHIFVTYFRANDFLTLQTVDIFTKEKSEVHGRAAITYDIAKKSGVTDFRNQPQWRNARHLVTDIRYRQQDPSIFYVFARSPDLDEAIFDQFVRSLNFDDDQSTSRDVQSFLQEPLTGSAERVTKKPFGIQITPESSPVEDERFSGYHTGTDFEVSTQELSQDIDVSAICDGVILSVSRASGYGGVIRQRCTGENGENLYVVYGHISQDDTVVSVDQAVSAGEKISELGDHKSVETDGERKHLHLGISTSDDLRGYVPREVGLANWQDYESIK